MNVKTVKNKSYLQQYEEFMKKEKTFTVRFYKEYEGEGGYWDEYDEWVSGPMQQDIVEEKTFSTIESALHFADTIQDRTLAEIIEQNKQSSFPHKDLEKVICWRSEIPFNFHRTDNKVLIYAYINWAGSNYKMKLTYTCNG